MRNVILIVGFITGMFQNAVNDEERAGAQKAEIPDAVSIEGARLEIRGVFEKEYMAYEKPLDKKMKREAGILLAYKLLEEERKGGHSDAVRYVLFYEAMIIATEEVDVEILIHAVIGLSEHFGEDGVRFLDVSLDDAKKKAKAGNAGRVL